MQGKTTYSTCRACRQKCTVNVDMIFTDGVQRPLSQSKYLQVHRWSCYRSRLASSSRLVHVVEEIVERRRVRHVVDDHHEIVWNIIRYRVRMITGYRSSVQVRHHIGWDTGRSSRAVRWLTWISDVVRHGGTEERLCQHRTLRQ